MQQKQGVDVDAPSNHFSAIDYQYLTIKQNADDHLRIQVWILDNPEMQSYLRITFTPQNLQNTRIIITLDPHKPTTMLDRLKAWMKVVEDLVAEFMPKLSYEEQ